ncbi:hypothetical protein G5S42_43265 [Paraburkholderia sp. JPY169]|uniref:Core-binding (CB) domain-containing protein n=2 Tax=Paraburkholderia youngii TaxID=2782701 RepID=A0A7Y6K825_9BURK|nr:hypothetical protein [Paraburkholderia youngii]
MKIAGAKKIGDDPLSLAALYRAGLGTKWHNKTEAAARLTSLGLRIHRNQIQQALAVSAFPREVLSLFRDVGLVHQTVRELVRAKNSIGMADLVSRAAIVDPAGKSRTEILAHLCGSRCQTDFRPTYKSESPLALHARYLEGLRLGTWATMREAAERMDIAHSRLVAASAVADLPLEITSVLPSDSLTFEVGRAIADLVAIRGVEAIRKQAVVARRLDPLVSPQRLLARLMGIEASQFLAKVKRAPQSRGRPGGLFVELHLDASDPDSESRLETLVGLLNVEFARRSATAGRVAQVSQRKAVPQQDRRQQYLAEQQHRLNRPVPLSRLSLPPHLSGSEGSNRSAAMLSVGICDDRSALEHWLSKFENATTRDRYQREVERLLLWAIIAKRKPLSSIDADDADEYINRFAANPQPRSIWVGKGQRSREDPSWRPFRGPLSDESRRRTLLTLRGCFDDLVAQDYLIANPFQGIDWKGIRQKNTYTEFGETSGE